MKEYLLLFVLFSVFGLAQNVESKKSFEFITIDDEILNDSLTVHTTNIDFSEYNKNFIAMEKESRDVIFSQLLIFKDHYYFSQWVTPIKIYLDESFDKEIRMNFKQFINTFKIPNLRIEVVKSKEEANYYFEVSKTPIQATQDDELLKKYPIYAISNFHYGLDTNKNKYYSKTNIYTGESNNNFILKTIKQLFFLNLGDFYFTEKASEESLLSSNYTNSNKLCKTDFDVLKLHYSTLFNQKIKIKTIKRNISTVSKQ